MSVSDTFLLVVRWAHLVSAAAWVGGSLFYLLVLRPALRRSPGSSGGVSAAAASDFRALVDTSILVLLVTGVILTFNRLSAGVVGVPYVAVLGIKIALSLWMFILARGRRRRVALLNTRPETQVTGRILDRQDRARGVRVQCHRDTWDSRVSAIRPAQGAIRAGPVRLIATGRVAEMEASEI